MISTLLSLLPGAALGLVAGVLSGMFGIGGAMITTPGMRLFLGASAMDAVATPLVGVIPSTLTGAYRYLKEGIADWRVGLSVGIGGALMGMLGAFIATELGGTVVMIGTAAVIVASAAQTLLSLRRTTREQPAAEQGGPTEAGDAESATTAVTSASATPPHPATRQRSDYVKGAAIGIISGLYSGFFGLGGGVIIVPALNRFLRMTYKQAIGTSLVSITLISLPALAMHAFLGNVHWMLALGLCIGVIPGAWIGSKITIGASERATSIGFALLLLVTGVWLGINELLGLS